MAWCVIFVVAIAAVCSVRCNIQPQYQISNKMTYVEYLKAVNRVQRDGLTGSEIQETLNVHNQVRRGEGSSNMNIVTWNDFMAGMAYDWAKGCNFSHGQPPRDPNTIPYNPLGQNLFYASGSSIDITTAVGSWYGEKNFYSYDSNTCQSNETCGHYTQWKCQRTSAISQRSCLHEM